MKILSIFREIDVTLYLVRWLHRYMKKIKICGNI